MCQLNQVSVEWVGTEYRNHYEVVHANIVRQLKSEFVINVDIPDKSTKHCAQATNSLTSQFFIGTTLAICLVAAILEFKMTAIKNVFISVFTLLIIFRLGLINDGYAFNKTLYFGDKRNYLQNVHENTKYQNYSI